MIVAVDHLTLSSSDFETDCAHVSDEGFISRFVALGVPNPNIKRPFVRTFVPTHDIGYFQAPHSLNIEVINQGTHDRSGTPELEPIWEDGFVRGFILRVSDLRNALKLWRALGFKIEKVSTGEAFLVFRSPTAKRLQIRAHLVSDPGRSAELFDTCGWGLPALVSTAPSYERDELQRAGFEVTPLETISVDNQNVTLFFVLAKGVPPVEIIGTSR